MATLKDFPGSQFTPDVAQSNWTSGPCGVTRDSEALERANFDSLCELLDGLDPYGTTWEILRFGHWAVGWIDEVFTAPDSPAQHCANTTRELLLTYHVLDESLLSEYEAEEMEECESK
jgi:hypothetical protein